MSLKPLWKPNSSGGIIVPRKDVHPRRDSLWPGIYGVPASRTSDARTGSARLSYVPTFRNIPRHGFADMESLGQFSS